MARVSLDGTDELLILSVENRGESQRDGHRAEAGDILRTLPVQL